MKPLTVLSVLAFLAAPPARAEDAPRKPNVLFVVADDLNNNLGCYGHPVVKSPNIDRLAARGLRFDRAYCQYPVCNPSRTSFLSGRRPDTTGVIDNLTPTRANLKDAVFLPQHFRRHGYHAVKVGKIYHTGDAFEDAASWDDDIRETREAKNPPEKQVVSSRGLSGVVLNADDADTWDGFVARKAAELMEKAARDGKPFFLAAGFRRPHTPYIAPKKYFDLYPPDKVRIAAEPLGHLKNIPAMAFTYKPDDRKMPDDRRREATAAYYASISFMDAQVGVLLDALDRLKLWDSTVVVFCSDHGYHLGEHGGMWHKMSLFEESARVPLIVAAPGKKAGTSSRLVELVDLYPTLAQLSGLPAPDGTEGTSFVPLLDDPQRPWKKAAFTVVSRGGALTATQKLDPSVMGRGVRTERWRYTEWVDGKEGAELYDHDKDPNEHANLAKDPAHGKQVAELRQMLKDGWKAALPAGR